jgi:hypothetical protein
MRQLRVEADIPAVVLDMQAAVVLDMQAAAVDMKAAMDIGNL